MTLGECKIQNEHESSERDTTHSGDEIKSVNNSEDLSYAEMKMGARDVWALGITIVIGGQYFSWNGGLTAGFGSNIVALFLVATMYLCLVFCNAELTSAFPFTGGAYGLGRLTIGLYGGFVVACCEAVEYIFYVASSAISLSNMIVSVSKSPPQYSLLYSLMFYIIALWIHIKGGHVFRYTNNILAVVSLLVILMYFFGSLQFVNFDKYASSVSTTGADSREYFIGGMNSFMNIFPLTAWFYVGVESLNLASSFVPNAREDIPKGSLACMLTLIATSILVLFACSSMPPTATDDDMQGSRSTSVTLSPLNDGFIRMFKMPSRFATALSIPATFATAYGFIFAYGRLIVSMARSSLFPKICLSTYGAYSTPYVSLIAGSLIGYCLCVLQYFVPTIGSYIFHVCIISGFFTYSCQFYGYLVFIRDHDSQERSFRNPLWIYGAIYGLIVAIIGMISVMGFQNDNGASFVSFVCLLIFYTVYYFGFARSRQNFSEEEKNLYFKCHVRGYNIKKRVAINKGIKFSSTRSSQKAPTTGNGRVHISSGARASIGESVRNSNIICQNNVADSHCDRSTRQAFGMNVKQLSIVPELLDKSASSEKFEGSVIDSVDRVGIKPVDGLVVAFEDVENTTTLRQERKPRECLHGNEVMEFTPLEEKDL